MVHNWVINDFGMSSRVCATATCRRACHGGVSSIVSSSHHDHHLAKTLDVIAEALCNDTTNHRQHHGHRLNMSFTLDVAYRH